MIKTFATKNGEILLGETFVVGKSLIFSGDRIVDIISEDEIDKMYPHAEIINGEGNKIVPGFIDLQLNGCGGVLLNDDISLNTLEVMHKTNMKYGCTLYTPTLITSTNENIEKALELMKSIEDKNKYGVLGLHLEGPFISKTKRGVHNINYVRTADEETINKIVEAGKDNVSIITMAPETTDGKIISKLHNVGINVALGHTNGTYEEITEKVPFGITLATHLYNGMSLFVPREPGAVGVIYNSDIKAGVIVDGVHAHYESIKIAKKIMGERLYLVTDAVSPAGTDMKSFVFEGATVYHENGRCFTADGTLGGSALTMDVGVRNLNKHCGMTLEEAIRMATLYPAKAVKIDNEYGKLAPGYYADIVFIDSDVNIKKVIKSGQLI